MCSPPCLVFSCSFYSSHRQVSWVHVNQETRGQLIGRIIVIVCSERTRKQSDLLFSDNVLLKGYGALSNLEGGVGYISAIATHELGEFVSRSLSKNHFTKQLRPHPMEAIQAIMDSGAPSQAAKELTGNLLLLELYPEQILGNLRLLDAPDLPDAYQQFTCFATPVNGVISDAIHDLISMPDKISSGELKNVSHEDVRQAFQNLGRDMLRGGRLKSTLSNAEDLTEYYQIHEDIGSSPSLVIGETSQSFYENPVSSMQSIFVEIDNTGLLDIKMLPLADQILDQYQREKAIEEAQASFDHDLSF